MRKFTLVFAILMGCAGAQQPAGDPLANDAGWQAANATMERHFETSALPPTLDVPVEALEFLLEDKVQHRRTVRDAYFELFETNDLPLRSAATLRMGQVDLNFACELVKMEAPDDFSPAESAIVEDMLAERTLPFFAEARRYLAQASNMGGGPYALAAGELVRDFPAGDSAADARAYCDKHRNAWYREPTGSFEARTVSACEAGLASSCYVASLIIANETRATDYAERACASGLTEACPRATGSDRMGPCGPDNIDACWRDAAAVSSDDLRDYSSYCSKGSGFDCFRRGILLEMDDALLRRCADGAISSAPSLDDARGDCTDGDVEACFQLGVATYTTPREVEAALDGRELAKRKLVTPVIAGDRSSVVTACIEQREAEACRRVAWSFGMGTDLPQSSVCAARFMFAACRVNNKMCKDFGELLE